MKNKIVIILGALVLLVSCGEYQQVLKSKDADYKFQKALAYFNAKEYVKAQTLFDDIAPYYKGTERSEDVLCYLARTHLGRKSYSEAADYYAAYIRNYPKGRYITEARFQVGHCYYLASPDARLDQEITRNAIDAFTSFVELYPNSPYSEQAYQEMNEMYDKLAYKEYLSAKLYYNLGTYLGNNYASCEITAKNALRDYPSNKHQEELSWLVFMAKYQQMVNSFEEKRVDRARDTQDEYYSFITDYPDSKHRAQANKVYKEIEKILQKVD